MATSAPLLQNDKLPPATAGAAVALELGVLHEGFSPDSRLSKGDQRVSMAPDVAEQLIKDGYGIIVEKGAGIYSGFTDQAFIQKGCKVAERAEVIRKSSVLFSIEPPEADFPACKGKIVISWVGRLLDKGKAVCEKAKSAGVMLIDVTAVPRITIAQKLDVLSSQAKCAGHRAVIEASYAFGRFHTAEMTAAGKYPPSQTFVLGCGVAGLAAIGTSKAMGSVVRAWDVRDVSDQVHSMGAKWVTVDFKESGEGQGGYAKESSDAFKRVQQETFRKVLAEVDIAISTAAIPGRPSPLLITKEAVSGMKPGSVIVDLAAQGGGNCELTKLNEIVTTPNGVTIIGYADMPARMASQASTMYAQNMCNLLRHIHGTGKASDFMKKLLGALDAPGDEGDIVSRSIVCTRDGKAVTMPPPPQPTPVKPKAAAPAEKKVVKEDPLKAAAAGAFVLTFGVCCMLAMGEGVKTSLLTTFLLAGAAGYQAVWGVAHALHTPLMSVTNAISGCTAIGGLLLMEKTSSPFAYLLASLALLVSAVNIFGGFVVSQRMLDLFKKPGDKDYTAMMLFPGLVFLFVSLTRPELLKAVSTVSALLCVAAIGGLATMSTANAGCKFGMVGVFGAMAATMVDMTEGNLVFAAILLAIGGVGGVVMGLKVSPIALPQTVAAFHSLVGLAATCTSIGSFVHHPVPGATMENTSCILGDFIGGITLTGSLIAFGKLNGNLRSSTDSSEEADTTWRSMTARCLGANERFTRQGSLMPRFLIDVLNSVSQVVFVTNSLSGALILLAMLIGAPRGAFLLGFFGALCATGISWLVGLDPDARREGLLGYNAVLVGAGFAVFVQNFLLAALGTLIFGMLSALLAAGLSRLVKPHLTLSFNVCILSGLALVHLMELEHLLPSESHSAEAVFQWISDFPLLDGLQFLKATLNGVSQIFLVTSPVSGVIVLVAICFVTPLGALSTLVGSIVATLGAAACGAEVLEVKKGIWGFNAALTALWVALHFRSQGPIPVLLLVLFASCCATGAFALLATATALSGWARAPFTLPFNAVAFFLVAVERCVLHREMCTKQRPQCTEENLATP